MVPVFGDREGKNMKKDDIYTDAPDDLDDAILSGTRVEDFLPPPELLVAKEETKKVTISLSARSIDFFKQVAKENHIPYQQMIRKVIDNYADHYAK